jgi:hypothetical protein
MHSADQREQINVGIYKLDICKNNILHYPQSFKTFLVEYLRNFMQKPR